MENQYCKVGAVNPMVNDGANAIRVLEYQYNNFMNKASNINDANLTEFFESKAQKVQKMLDNLI